jgi:hypothetical protein
MLTQGFFTGDFDIGKAPQSSAIHEAEAAMAADTLTPDASVVAVRPA